MKEGWLTPGLTKVAGTMHPRHRPSSRTRGWMEGATRRVWARLRSRRQDFFPN